MREGDAFAFEEFGKVPPQAIDIEEAVLGALMIESEAIHDIVKEVKAEHFYKDSHQLIYTAIIDIYRSSGQIDILTVTEQIKKMGKLEVVGGAYYITELTTKVNQSAHLESHAKIIVEKWLRRTLIRLSSIASSNAYSDSIDALTLMDTTISDLMAVMDGITRGKETSYPDLLDQSLALTMERMESDDELVGLPTGLSELDAITSGMQGPDLIIIAGRPGMGKTALAVQIANYVAKTNPAAVVSMEMSSLQLTQRNQSNRAEILLKKIQTGKELANYDVERLIFVTTELKKDQLYVDDTPNLLLLELRAKIFTLVHKHGVKLVVIDYLQLMKYEGNSRDEGIGLISKGIKAIAKELNIPIILLSQLSRAVEQRGGSKRPQLSDLRESGSIEQDADAVWFIYRPEYYGLTQDEQGNSLVGVAELIIAKHRNGALDTVSLNFIGKFMKFTDYRHDVPEASQELNFQGEAPLEELPF